ncbi:MAG: hypothetical protein WCG31_02935 [Deltaproteobacteria bacterium]|jgi:hypothetical protein
MEKAKNIAVNIIAIAAVCLLLIWGETCWRQRVQFAKGEAALARMNYIEAIDGYAAAIHMYTPGSSLVQKSAVRIWSIGDCLERAGDSVLALVAYRALRSSFYAAKGLYTPGKEWISRCDEKIASLVKLKAGSRALSPPP